MTAALIITLLLQTLAAIPRASVENPAVTEPVPAKLKKDYDKLWQRFARGKEDDKVMKDTDKLLQKNPNVVALVMLEAYIDLYGHRTSASEAKFEQVLKLSPNSKVALSYLSDAALNREDYRRALDLYSRLLAADPSRTDVEPKRQKALLRATQDIIASASAAEKAGHFDEAEAQYSQAVQLAPQEPSLHEKLGGLYAKQMKWEPALAEFRKSEALGGTSDEIDRQVAEALVHLGRADEARSILDRLKKSGAREDGLEDKLNELEDLGRWGSDLPTFHAIQNAPLVTRYQLALLLVRYFPQLSDGRRTSVIMTDVRDESLLPVIQTVVGTGLMDVRPNRTFQPSGSVTRGEFASALARLINRLGISTPAVPPIPLTDVAASNARYKEIQTILAHDLMTLDDNGNFNVNDTISGADAITAITKVLDLSRG
jgi:tetratricopeptide (TPR) repeat protein